jgi:phosphohistidine phosphatase
MTRTLILIRHTKSDWDDPGLDDHDRPLNDRGRLSAPRIGAWLAEQGFEPDAVLCSTARRTRETWEGIATQLPGAPEPVYSAGLYHAAPVDMLNAIRDSDAAILAVMATTPASARWHGRSVPQRRNIQKFGLYPTGPR